MTPLEKTKQFQEAIAPEFSSVVELADFLGNSERTWYGKIKHTEENCSLDVQSIVALVNRLGFYRFLEIVGILAGCELQVNFQTFSEKPLILSIFCQYNSSVRRKQTTTE